MIFSGALKNVQYRHIQQMYMQKQACMQSTQQKKQSTELQVRILIIIFDWHQKLRI